MAGVWLLLAVSCFLSQIDASPPVIDLSNSIAAINERPIIGILSQEPPPSLASFSPLSKSYIAASYVKFVEAAGARAVPIRIDQPEEYYASIVQSVNGLLFPGGGSSLSASGYGRAGALLYDLAVAANERGDYFPVWGTCLGFELLTYLTAGRRDLLTQCQSWNRALPLDILPDGRESRLLRNADPEIYDTLTSDPSTSNFHHWCLTPDNFTGAGLDDFYRLLSTSRDDEGMVFVSALEARRHPIWAVQFHPEKNLFEWSPHYASVPHSASAVAASLYFARFFVDQARQNSHAFASPDEEARQLIYNHQLVYTGQVSDSFVQCYFFD